MRLTKIGCFNATCEGGLQLLACHVGLEIDVNADQPEFLAAPARLSVERKP